MAPATPAHRADLEAAARRPLKRNISQKGWIPNKEALQQFVDSTFYQLADKLDWADKWIEDILNPALASNYAIPFCIK